MAFYKNQRSYLLALTLSMLAVSSSFIQPAYAETCREQFIRIFAPSEKSQKSLRSYNTATTNGENEQKFNLFSIGDNHILSQALVPAAPWSLIYNQQMFISNDKGKSWIKVRDLPDNELDEAALAAKTTGLAKIGNEECGTDTYEGKETNTIQADLDVTPEAPFKTTVKFWMDTETGNMLKSTTRTIMPGADHFVTQIIEQAPDLVLPTPD